MTHFDHANLVEIGHAMDWIIEERLAHLASCSDCRQELEFLAMARKSMAAELTPRPGFTEEVLGTLEPVRATAPLLLRAVNAGLAAMVCFFVLAVAGSSGAPIGPGAGVFVFTILTGVVAFAGHNALNLPS